MTVVAALFGAGLMLALPQYATRVASIGDVAARSLGFEPSGLRSADGAARGRVTEMKATGLVFLDHPVLGAGPGMAQRHYAEHAAMVGGKVRAGVRRSHNLFLQLAAETGLIGLAAFGAVVFFAIRGLERTRRRYAGRDPMLWSVASGLELALVVSLATSLFLHAAYVRYFWLLLGLCAAVGTIERAPVLVRFLNRLLEQTTLRFGARP